MLILGVGADIGLWLVLGLDPLNIYNMGSPMIHHI